MGDVKKPEPYGHRSSCFPQSAPAEDESAATRKTTRNNSHARCVESLNDGATMLCSNESLKEMGMG